MGARPGQSCQPGCMSPGWDQFSWRRAGPGCSSTALEKHALAGQARACPGSQNVHSPVSTVLCPPSHSRLLLRQ